MTAAATIGPAVLAGQPAGAAPSVRFSRMIWNSGDVVSGGVFAPRAELRVLEYPFYGWPVEWGLGLQVSMPRPAP